MVKRNSYEEVLGRERIYDACRFTKRLVIMINAGKLDLAESLIDGMLETETSYYIDCVVEATTLCDWYRDKGSDIGYLWSTNDMIDTLCKREVRRKHKWYVYDFNTEKLLFINKCSSRGLRKF